MFIIRFMLTKEAINSRWNQTADKNYPFETLQKQHLNLFFKAAFLDI